MFFDIARGCTAACSYGNSHVYEEEFREGKNICHAQANQAAQLLSITEPAIRLIKILSPTPYGRVAEIFYYSVIANSAPICFFNYGVNLCKDKFPEGYVKSINWIGSHFSNFAYVNLVTASVALAILGNPAMGLTTLAFNFSYVWCS